MYHAAALHIVHEKIRSNALFWSAVEEAVTITNSGAFLDRILASITNN